MKTQYGDKITLRLGMEFGMQVHTIEQYEKLYVKYPFDFQNYHNYSVLGHMDPITIGSDSHKPEHLLMK